ncbi:hypothetical protein BDU57DRAFT_517075 [Ampelomyces quisqualis]|uniref:Uncharacterized protein n=1 Tax=Ampelomyces quisqualis TaxID=50730 RepID=A0A6A5QMV2_AMPQU|nr:hypothetical protein BDU57DRAFT_517075 [Ampelomyces quisqualis]
MYNYLPLYLDNLPFTYQSFHRRRGTGICAWRGRSRAALRPTRRQETDSGMVKIWVLFACVADSLSVGRDAASLTCVLTPVFLSLCVRAVV